MLRFGKRSLIAVSLIACLCLILIAGCGGGSKQTATKEIEYPTGPITITVGFNPGGSADTSARTAAEFLSKKLGKPVVVVNKPGSNGSLAAKEVLKTKPDGYNLLISSGGNMTIIPNNMDIGYTQKDFTHIAQLTDGPSCLAVPKDAPYKTLKEFIEYAKKNKGKVRFGTTGVLSTQQLGTKALSDLEGLDLQVVPYNGAPAAVVSMLGGHIEAVSVMTADLVAQAPMVRVLAVYGPKRDPLFPDAPTMTELGYKDFDVFTIWYGISGPKGMPEPIVKKLEAALKECANDPTVLEQWKKMSLQAAYQDSKEFGATIERRSNFFKKILDQIKAEGAAKNKK